MAKRFPHLKDAPAAFGAGRELYEQIPGDFDQSRWREATAHAKLMSVPWCGDYDNVVAFSSDEARDAWIDSQDGHAFDTEWRRPPEGSYKVEVPYATALLYNYLVLDLPTPTSDANPLPGASERGFRRLCYFVTDVRQSAASTSELTIDLDVWATFMGTLEVSYLQLEQGHAPMAEVSPEEFLADPLGTQAHLLCPDVGAGAPSLAASAHEANLNDSVTVVIFTTARLTSGWGDKYGATPADNLNYNGAATSTAVAWAVSSGDLDDFIVDVVAQHPSFLQTVQGIASVPTRLLSLSRPATFCGHTLWRCSAQTDTRPLVDLSVDDFGYHDAYRGIAKLYTSPYAHLEITDETGETTVVRVEETQGSVDVYATISLAWPYLKVATALTGVGRSRASRALSWHVVEGRFGATLPGSWYDTLREHDIPVFAVCETSATNYDWASHHVNEQRRSAAQNAYASETASAGTANTNALAQNSTARTNASNNAANVTSNNALTVAANTAIAARNQSAAAEGAQLSTDKLASDTQQDISTSSAAYEAEQAGLAVAATNNNAQATVGGATTIVSGVAEAAASFLTGDIGGGVGAIASTIGGAAQVGTSWAAANASISVSQSNSTEIYNATMAASLIKSNNARNYTAAATGVAQNAITDNVDTQNDTSTSVAANNAALINQNAANVKSTGDANANRTLATANDNAARTRDTALAAVSADIAQAALGNVIVHGEQSPGPSALRPMMVQATVVTQSPGEIALAGDHMLRYGYACDFAWHVTDWCPCKRFCYWRASDVWMTGAGNVSERYQRMIKDILLRGVTVWKDPNDIGRVSVHDNGF